jgi:hypothetical protein
MSWTSRLERAERLAGAGASAGVAAVRVHFGQAGRRPVRRLGAVCDVFARGVCPFRRLAVIPRDASDNVQNIDRRPGEPTARRAAVIRRALWPLLDGGQRRLVEGARFITIIPPPD